MTPSSPVFNDPTASEVAQTYLELYDEYFAATSPTYQHYIDGVGLDKMAIPQETAVLLLAICRVQQPRRILDLGSGLSSWVLRTWAKDYAEGPVEVVSVDDHDGWLETTRTYLEDAGLPEGELLAWNVFKERTPAGEFDLVFHDLGNMDTRREALPHIVEHVQPETGRLLLDDLHKEPYRNFVRGFFADRSGKITDLESVSKDRFDRFCWLVESL